MFLEYLLYIFVWNSLFYTWNVSAKPVLDVNYIEVYREDISYMMVSLFAYPADAYKEHYLKPCS